MDRVYLSPGLYDIRLKVSVPAFLQNLLTITVVAGESVVSTAQKPLKSLLGPINLLSQPNYFTYYGAILPVILPAIPRAILRVILHGIVLLNESSTFTSARFYFRLRLYLYLCLCLCVLTAYTS